MILRSLCNQFRLVSQSGFTPFRPSNLLRHQLAWSERRKSRLAHESTINCSFWFLVIKFLACCRTFLTLTTFCGEGRCLRVENSLNLTPIMQNPFRTSYFRAEIVIVSKALRFIFSIPRVHLGQTFVMLQNASDFRARQEAVYDKHLATIYYSTVNGTMLPLTKSQALKAAHPAARCIMRQYSSINAIVPWQ